MLYWDVTHKRMAACLESVGEWILALKIQPSGQALGWVDLTLSQCDKTLRLSVKCNKLKSLKVVKSDEG